MQIHEFPQIGEKLYSTRLPNGLEIRVVPKKDFATYYAAFATNYGGAHRRFSIDGKTVNLEQDEAQYVKDVLKLTRTEVRSITQFERGEALVHSNNNKVPVIIKASKQEQEMITTDRAELEAILRKRQQQNI